MTAANYVRARLFAAVLVLLVAIGRDAYAEPSVHGTQEALPGIGRTGYAIQVAAFADERHAITLMEKLRSRGMHVSYARKENGLYSVYSGDFPNRETAGTSAEKLVSTGVISSYYLFSLKELVSTPTHVREEPENRSAVSHQIQTVDHTGTTKPHRVPAISGQHPPVRPEHAYTETGKGRIGTPKLVPYDKELYETGYTVFMQAGNLGDALVVAEAAVAQRPQDSVWRRRAARTAEWSSQPATALDHWFVLAVEHNDPEGMNRALALAEGAGYHARRLVLLQIKMKRGVDEALLKDVIEACELTGEPEKAIAILTTIKSSKQRGFVLAELARLYQMTGKPAAAIASYRELAAVSRLSSHQRLLLATLLYGTRDLEAAYRVLVAGADEFYKDREYQETLSDVCWAMQDIPCAGSASERLLNATHARDVDYQRIIYRFHDNDPAKALVIAQQGWQVAGKSVFFFSAAELLNRIGDSRRQRLLFEGLSSEQHALLSTSTYFWTLRSQAYRLTGDVGESMRSYRRAMALEPGNEGVLAGYIWLLLDSDRYDEVKDFLHRTAGKKDSSAELVDARAAGYAYTGDFKMALELFRNRYSHYRDDPVWLAGYADVLEQNGQDEAAFQERLKGLSITLKRLKGTDLAGEASRKFLLDHVRHALRLSRDRRLDTIVAVLARGTQDDVTRELVTAWALATERSELARLWLWRAYALNAVRPYWIQLGLALEANDRYAIAALLNERLQRLPYRDAIEGARKVGQIPLAEEHAFEKSLQNPDDQQLYKQLRDMYGERPSLIRNRFRISDQGGVVGQENAVTVSSRISQRYSVFADMHELSLLSRKANVLAASPAHDLSAHLGIRGRYEHLKLAIAAGGRTALESFPYASLSAQYGITSRDNIALELTYGGTAAEGVPISLIGMKHEAALSATHSFDGHTTVQMRFAASRLLDQGGTLLGESRAYSADLSRSLTLDYPDYALRIFGGYYDYRRKGVPFAKALAFVPQGSARDASFFVPESFLQTGLGTSFGMAYRDQYSKSWKPFGNADIIWNSVSKEGFRYELGIHGPLFGYDTLFFSASQESGSFGSTSMNSSFETGYTWLFN